MISKSDKERDMPCDPPLQPVDPPDGDPGSGTGMGPPPPDPHGSGRGGNG